MFGCIYLTSAKLTLEDSEVTKNEASLCGGAITFEGQEESDVTLRHTSFLGNVAKVGGGVICSLVNTSVDIIPCDSNMHWTGGNLTAQNNIAPAGLLGYYYFAPSAAPNSTSLRQCASLFESAFTASFGPKAMEQSASSPFGMTATQSEFDFTIGTSGYSQHIHVAVVDLYNRTVPKSVHFFCLCPLSLTEVP